jgi:hypothetical protein
MKSTLHDFTRFTGRGPSNVKGLSIPVCIYVGACPLDVRVRRKIVLCARMLCALTKMAGLGQFSSESKALFGEMNVVFLPGYFNSLTAGCIANVEYIY